VSRTTTSAGELTAPRQSPLAQEDAVNTSTVVDELRGLGETELLLKQKIREGQGKMGPLIDYLQRKGWSYFSVAQLLGVTNQTVANRHRRWLEEQPQ
jgi:hypothetical protein